MANDTSIEAMAKALNENMPTTDLTKEFIKKSVAIRQAVLEEVDKNEIRQLVENDLKKWISRIFTYQVDFRNFTFSNVDTKFNDFIKKYNFNGYMTLKHARASRIKNECGKVAYFVKPLNPVITQPMELNDEPTISNDKITNVSLTKNYISQINSKDYIETYDLTLTKEGVLVQVWNKNLNDYDDKILINETTIANMKYIPVVIDYANEMGEAEWENVKASIDFYSNFESKVQKEFEYLKVQMLLNPQFTDKTAKELQEKIEKGDDRIIEDFNENASQALNMLTNGGITTDIARSIRDDYKETIKEQLFLISQSSGKNNKHTNETMNDNVYAYCYAWFKKGLFSETISRLYWMIADISNKVSNAGLNLPKFLECEAQMSRPLEIALNLNSNGKEQDAPTTVSVREDTIKTIDQGGK